MYRLVRERRTPNRKKSRSYRARRFKASICLRNSGQLLWLRKRWSNQLKPKRKRPSIVPTDHDFLTWVSPPSHRMSKFQRVPRCAWDWALIDSVDSSKIPWPFLPPLSRPGPAHKWKCKVWATCGSVKWLSGDSEAGLSLRRGEMAVFCQWLSKSLSRPRSSVRDPKVIALNS